jgi:hypothetical protein
VSGFTSTITDPVAALKAVGKENSELHEELRRVQNEHYHFLKALNIISKMGVNTERAPAIATRAMQLRPLDV